jgi:hypothetical protein
MSVIQFPAPRNDHVVIDCGTSKETGEKVYWIDLLYEGAWLNVWQGLSYADALDEAQDVRRDGVQVIDKVRRADA